MKILRLNSPNNLKITSFSLRNIIIWTCLEFLSIWLITTGTLSIILYIQASSYLIPIFFVNILFFLNIVGLNLLSWVCFYFVSGLLCIFSLSRLGKIDEAIISSNTIQIKKRRWFFKNQILEIEPDELKSIQIIQDSTSDHATLFLESREHDGVTIATTYGKEGIKELNTLGKEIHELFPSSKLVTCKYVDPAPPEEENQNPPAEIVSVRTCPKCKINILDNAGTCPNCGFIFKKIEKVENKQ
ncbi:MAG: hypothetical protein ACTSRW_11075 [Candidatus Helarchaeota archaeon]